MYEKTYWGQAREEIDGKKIDEEIIKNRNKFIEEWDIKKNVENMPNYVKEKSKIYGPSGREKFGDHSEIYKIREGYIIIVSPYVGEKSQYDEEAKEKGYKKIYQMYNKYAETYLKVIVRGFS